VPFYGYKCENCGQKAERHCSVDRRDDDLWCTTCEGPMTRVLIAPAFQFKTSGSTGAMSGMRKG
jgi:putative FmdB family regulatory protein